MKAYSLDFRKKIVGTYFTESISQRELARRFWVSLSFVEKLLKQLRETGNLAPKAHGGGHPSKLNAQQIDLVKALVDADNDATLAELCEQFQRCTQVSVSPSTLGRVLRNLNLTVKKNAACQRAGDSPRSASPNGLLADDPDN